MSNEPLVEPMHEVEVTVNGLPRSATVPARRLLSDFLRHDLRLTGTHVGCEHGVCGACTVLLDGAPIRSCLTFAVAVDGRELTTIEGLAAEDGTLHPVQQAFQDHHGLQCGFCTPGFVMSACGYLAANPDAEDPDEIREEMAGNLCRCTGYAGILAAVKQAAGVLREAGTDALSPPAPAGTDPLVSPAPAGTDPLARPAPAGTDPLASPAPAGTDPRAVPASATTDATPAPDEPSAQPPAGEDA